MRCVLGCILIRYVHSQGQEQRSISIIDSPSLAELYDIFPNRSGGTPRNLLQEHHSHSARRQILSSTVTEEQSCHTSSNPHMGEYHRFTSYTIPWFPIATNARTLSRSGFPSCVSSDIPRACPYHQPRRPHMLFGRHLGLSEKTPVGYKDAVQTPLFGVVSGLLRF